MTVQFVVAVEEEVLLAVRARVAREVELEQQWWQQRRVELGVQGLHGSRRREALAELRRDRRRRREAGECLPTQRHLLTFFTRRTLAEQGWARAYDPVPAGERGMPGRPLGRSPLSDLSIGVGLTERLYVELPSEVGEQVRRAAYWESAEAVRELLAWADRYGRGPAAEGAEGFAAELRQAMGLGPSAEALRRREELRRRVLTTGDILRRAAQAAGGDLSREILR
ncbi:hypothetical protein GA0070616_0073 [Micromonospora nigra]|uniref:Uncharacterized protein n=1 Tax=Micromonospora nigra TaxID=145857 RepID=A0A1C6R7F3_9ACTN|nr:hypothetical protein [Micromonospora nigra]SCL12946.1 hypothetical protein GA0070616_0073 [Micromonospora nigra]